MSDEKTFVQITFIERLQEYQIIFEPLVGIHNFDFDLLVLKARYHLHQKDSQNLMISIESFYFSVVMLLL